MKSEELLPKKVTCETFIATQTLKAHTLTSEVISANIFQDGVARYLRKYEYYIQTDIQGREGGIIIHTHTHTHTPSG